MDSPRIIIGSEWFARKNIKQFKALLFFILFGKDNEPITAHFHMDSNMIDSTSSLDLYIHKPDIERLKTDLEKAVRLVVAYDVPRADVIEAKMATRSALSRAIISASRGFTIGDNQKLSPTDEETLEKWISEFLEQGESMFPWKVISLVCSYLKYIL